MSGKKNTAAALSWPNNLLADIADGKLDSIGPYNGNSFSDFNASLNYVLELLETRRNPNQYRFLMMRYHDGMTNARIAVEAGITGERVRQVLNLALAYLRHPDRLRYLQKGVSAVVHDSANNGYHRGLAKGRSESRDTARAAYVRGFADACGEGDYGPDEAVADIAAAFEVLSRPVSDFTMKPRTANVLAKAHITRIGQLAAMDRKAVMALKDCGETTVADIERLVDSVLRDGSVGEDMVRLYAATLRKQN